MGVHQLQFKLELPIPIREAWDFFSHPKNLELITPPDMKFKIVSNNLSENTYAGQMIKYNLQPITGIRVTWLTEITHVNSPYYFVDEQRKGPYKIWHHEHEFISSEQGIIMIDKLTYELPLGFLGEIANWLFVRKRIDAIFEYRREQLIKLFPDKKS